MNNIFKILWLEDEADWFKMEVMHVDEILQPLCLLPEIVKKNGDDLNQEDLKNNSFDLIVMDYGLADGIKGTQLAESIRNNNILTDILFYSSDEIGMLSTIFKMKPPLDGVFYAKRDHSVFGEKLAKVIQKIIRRSEDVVNLRGLVMDYSCDFEVRIHHMLLDVWKKITEEEKKKLNAITKEAINAKKERFTGNCEKSTHKDPLFVAAVDNKPHVFTNTDKLYLMTKVMDILKSGHGFMNNDEILNDFKVNYEKDISIYRNAFGHKKAKENYIKVGQKEIAIDSALYLQMRQNINTYDKSILKIEGFISALPDE